LGRDGIVERAVAGACCGRGDGFTRKFEGVARAVDSVVALLGLRALLCCICVMLLRCAVGLLVVGLFVPVFGPVFRLDTAVCITVATCATEAVFGYSAL
jgi:hypothetical protein